MATISRVLRKILLKEQINPIFTRNISSVKCPKTYKNVWTTCACVIGGSVLLYTANIKYRRNTVYALKAKDHNVNLCKSMAQVEKALECLEERRYLGYARIVCSYARDHTRAAWQDVGNGCVKTRQQRAKQPEELARSVKLTSRERRFIKFASVEFGGQLYMTPQDFLESVVEQEPRPRLKRRVLTTKEIEHLRDHTPPLKKGSPQMFRNLRDKGIISYTEYLFLLSILTKPASGFQIAFNMFDTDGNQRVDKNEFLVIQRLLGGSLKERKDLDTHSQQALLSLVSTSAQKRKEDSNTKKDKTPSRMEKIFSFAWKDKRGMTEKEGEEKQGGKGGAVEYGNDDQGLQRRHNTDTMLQVHFFGKKGTNDLKFEGFRQFMENLQTEVLELEFNEFSKGQDTISEVDFAKILLRYTYLDTDEYDMYLDRLLDRVFEEEGITFEEFKTFCQFLNNLEDFTIAMRMYTLADHPISKDEFHRAVKICTGVSQSAHLVSTVFAIFDADGDGLLSYKEFIAIMKDRLHRGFKSYAKNEGWEAFKTCVKQEMKSAV